MSSKPLPRSPPGEAGSLFEPHHMIEIFFPALELLDHGKEINVRMKVEHAEYRSSEAETSFTSLIQVSDEARTLANRTIANDILMYPTINDCKRLKHDMLALRGKEGCTQLRLVCFRIGPNGGETKGERWLHVLKQTTEKTGNGQFVCGERKYTLRATDFQNLNLEHEMWWSQICNLIVYRSDRAELHARARDAHRDFFDAGSHTVPWQPKRTTDISSAMAESLPFLSRKDLKMKPDDEHVCAICRETFFNGIALPRLLPCQHIVCATCTQHWAEQQGLAEANCPVCRRKFFSQQRIIQVRWGEDVNGVYIRDWRFSHWENAERSYADLDCVTAANDDNSQLTLTSIHPFYCAIDDITAHFRAEPPDSTPVELNPALFEECDVTIHHVMTKLAKWKGKKFTPAALLERLTESYTKHLNRAIGRIEGDIYPRWRPGFKEFVANFLNRMVRFVQMRECDGEEPTHRTTHRHGEFRMFWHKD